MKRVTLEAEPRSETGKGAARSMRREGWVPGVVYGHGEETRSCKVGTVELKKLLTSISYENTVINLKMDGETRPVLIREVQVHPYKPEVLHVDFLAIHKGEKIRVEVPIRLVGEAPGVEEGGIMEHARHEVEVRCDPDAIPEFLELDVSTLDVGDSLSIGDLQVPSGVEILAESGHTVCAVVPPTKVEEVVPAVEEELELEELEELEEAVAEGELEAEMEEEGAPEEAERAGESSEETSEGERQR